MGHEPAMGGKRMAISPRKRSPQDMVKVMCRLEEAVGIGMLRRGRSMKDFMSLEEEEISFEGVEVKKRNPGAWRAGDGA